LNEGANYVGFRAAR